MLLLVEFWFNNFHPRAVVLELKVDQVEKAKPFVDLNGNGNVFKVFSDDWQEELHLLQKS